MSNPFEDENATYRVLMNDEGQHSLWPSFAEIPDGWRVVHEEDSRQACLDYVEEHWTDMRPNSLIEAMELDKLGK
jgi:MbtH protein